MVQPKLTVACSEKLRSLCLLSVLDFFAIGSVFNRTATILAAALSDNRFSVFSTVRVRPGAAQNHLQPVHHDQFGDLVRPRSRTLRAPWTERD